MTSKINLSDSNQQALDTFGSWTNLGSAANATTANILEFVGGADTGWDITATSASMVSGVDGVDAAGSGDAAWVDEARPSDNYHTISGTSDGQYTIGGLDNAKTYTILVFASRDSLSSTRTGEYSVDGFSTTQEIDAKQNSTITATYTDVSPSSGNILLDWRVKGDEGFAYLNAIQITENGAVGGTIDTVDATKQFNSTINFTTSGFSTLTSWTLTDSLGNVINLTGGSASAAMPDYGNSVDRLITGVVTLEVSDGTLSDTITLTLEPKTNYSSVKLTSGFSTTSESYLFGYSGTPAIGDEFHYVASEITLNADGSWETPGAGVTTIYGVDATDGVMERFTHTTGESEEVDLEGGIIGLSLSISLSL